MVETITDVQAARNSLLRGEISQADFDAKYGEGATAQIMRGTYGAPAEQPTAAPVAPQQDSGGFLSTLGDMVQGAANGVEEAINQTAATIDSAGTYLEDKFQTGRLVWEDKNNDGKVDSLVPSWYDYNQVQANKAELGQDMLTNFLENDLEFVDDPTTMAGGITQGLSQFLTGFVALGGGKTFVGSMLKGAVVDATVFDPYEANLSSFLKENGWADNAITDALATDPNAPEWENRLRNSLEGGVVGTALEGVVRSVKFVATSRKATQEIEELGQVSDETAAELDQAHEEAVAAEEDLAKPKGLEAQPDGTFKAPDGTTYKPEGEQLVEQPKPAADPEVQTDAPQMGDAPTAPTRDEQLKANLEEQVKPEIIKPKPKVELIDRERLGQALDRAEAMGDFELRNIDEGGWFNLGRMEGPVEAAKIIDSFQTVLADSKTAARMGLDKPETHDQVIRQSLKYIAGNTGTDVNKLIRDLNVSETMSRDMAARIVAGKMALQSTGREITKMAQKLKAAVNSGDATENMDRQLIDLMQTHMELQANVKGLQTAAARATSAGRIVTKDALSSDTLDTLSAFGGSKRVRRIAQQLALVTDDAKRSKSIRKVMERKWLRVLNEYWINQILSGPTTHALNITSNTINMVVRPGERAVGALFNLDGAEAVKAFKQYQFMASYFKDSIVMAAKAGWNHRPILDEAVKFDTAQGETVQRAISAEYLGVKPGKIGSTIDAVGKMLTMSSRALATEDEFFKQLTFRSHLKADLVAEAARMTDADLKKSGYATRDEFIEAEFERAFMTKISAEEAWQEAVLLGKVVDDPKVKEEFINRSIGTANEGNARAMAALNEARSTTFTNPLQPGTMSHSFQTMANKHPVLRQITPFIQTPMNIMQQAWDRTPGLNLMREQYRADLKSADPAVRAQAKGKMVMGVATYTALTALAIDGRITGGGPTDPKRAALYRNSPNWQPYSINIGTAEKPEWISYQRMDPWTTAFGIVGDISEMIEMGQMADSDAADVISMTIAAIGNNIMSKTYLQGIADTVEIMNSKDRPWEVTGFLQQRGASMLPFSSLTNQLGAGFDDNLREVRSYVDRLKQQSGIMRDQLPLKYDWVTGQPLETPEKSLGYIAVKQMSEEDRQAAEIYTEMRKIGARWSGAERKISGVTLTGEQYQRWNQLMGEVKLGGMTLSDRLYKTIKTDRYNQGGDDYNLVTTQESHRYIMLGRVISKYRQITRKMLMKEYPELRQAVIEYDRYTTRSKAGVIGDKPIIDMNELQ